MSDLIDILLKSKSNKIWSFLTQNPERSFYDKEISQETGVSRGATNQILNSLHGSNLLKREKRGRMWFYALKDYEIAKYFRIYNNLIEAKELANKLELTVKRMILFGSAAKGNDTADSDVDIFVLTDDKNKAASIIREFRMSREIKPIIQTPVEYAKARSKNKIFYEEVEKGIVLLDRGIDEQRL